MIKVAFSQSFKRAFKKRIAGNFGREERFWSKLELLSNDVFDPSLRTHKLSGKFKNQWSFGVEYDLRVIFHFVDDENVLLIDIGTHKEVY